MALKVQSIGGGPRDLVFRVADVTFSSSYPASGEPIVPSDFEMTKVLFVACETAYAGKLQPVYDPTAGTLRLLGTGSGAGAALSEVATAANESAITARVLVVGIK